MRKNEYRIVYKYNDFFNNWYYVLERKSHFSKLYKYLTNVEYIWFEVASTSLGTREVPEQWRELNIVEEIKQEYNP